MPEHAGQAGIVGAGSGGTCGPGACGRHGDNHPMGIVAFCPNGHRIKVKDELAGRKGICPTCSAKFRIPRKDDRPANAAAGDATAGTPTARVVSLDPLYAGSLPAAFALDEAETIAAAAIPEPAVDAPDFLLIDDEQGSDDRETAAWTGPAPAIDGFAAGGRPASHAALDERPDLAWCVAVRGGAPSAPRDAAAMRAWLDSGAGTADHVVWRQDWPEWRPLVEVFPEAGSAASGDHF